MTSRDSGGRFALSLGVGLLLIPLSAAAGFAIVNGIATQPEEPNTTLALEVPTTSATEVVVEPVAAGADDLIRACGADGMSLIDAENAGLLTDVQQAALDALRQICDEAGMALPGPAAPPPVVKTVVQASDGSSTSAGQSGGNDDDSDDHDSEDHDSEDDDSGDHDSGDDD